MGIFFWPLMTYRYYLEIKLVIFHTVFYILFHVFIIFWPSCFQLKTIMYCQRTAMHTLHALPLRYDCNDFDEPYNFLMMMMWFYVTHSPFSRGLDSAQLLIGTFAGAVSIFGPDALPVIHQ